MLTSTEKSQLATLATREGGIETLISEIRDAAADDTKAAALSTLAPMLTVTVTDWAGIQAWVQANKTDNKGLYAILTDLKAAFAARDASKLGPLLVALVAKVLGHTGQ